MAWVMSNHPDLCWISYEGGLTNNRPVKAGAFYYVGVILVEGFITLSPLPTFLYVNVSNAYPLSGLREIYQ